MLGQLLLPEMEMRCSSSARNSEEGLDATCSVSSCKGSPVVLGRIKSAMNPDALFLRSGQIARDTQNLPSLSCAL